MKVLLKKNRWKKSMELKNKLMTKKLKHPLKNSKTMVLKKLKEQPTNKPMKKFKNSYMMKTLLKKKKYSHYPLKHQLLLLKK